MESRYTKWLGDIRSNVSWFFPSIFSFSANVFVKFWNYGYGSLIIQVRECSFLPYFPSWFYLFLKCLIEFTRKHGPFDKSIFFFFSFLYCAQGMRKFLGQGSNLRHSSKPSHSSDNTRSLTTRPPENPIIHLNRHKAFKFVLASVSCLSQGIHPFRLRLQIFGLKLLKIFPYYPFNICKNYSDNLPFSSSNS